MLTVAGVISLVIGSLMLFRSADPAIRVSLDLIIGMSIFTLVVVALLLTLVVRAHSTQVTTGAEGLLNKQGVARTAIEEDGKVFVHGELWSAVADRPIAAGTAVKVVGVKGLKLAVRPLQEKASEIGGEVL